MAKRALAFLWPSPTGGAHPRPLPFLAKGLAPLTPNRFPPHPQHFPNIPPLEKMWGRA